MLYFLCRKQDQIVMVNGVTMENTTSQQTIQQLKSCGKTANIVSTTTNSTDQCSFSYSTGSGLCLDSFRSKILCLHYAL